MGSRLPEGRSYADAQVVYAASMLEQLDRTNGEIGFGSAIANTVENLLAHGFRQGDVMAVFGASFGGFAGFFSDPPMVRLEKVHKLFADPEESVFLEAHSRTVSWRSFFQAGGHEPRVLPGIYGPTLQLGANRDAYGATTFEQLVASLPQLVAWLPQCTSSSRQGRQQAVESLGEVLGQSCFDACTDPWFDIPRLALLARTITGVRRSAVAPFLGTTPRSAGVGDVYVPFAETAELVSVAIAQLRGESLSRFLEAGGATAKDDCRWMRTSLDGAIAQFEQEVASCPRPEKSLVESGSPRWSGRLLELRLREGVLECMRRDLVEISHPDPEADEAAKKRLEAIGAALVALFRAS